MNTLTASRLIASGNGQPLFTLHCDFGQEQCRAMLKSCLIPCGSFATHLPCPSYQPGLCDQYCERHVFYSEEQKKFVACCPDCSAPDFTVEEEDMRMFMVSGAYVAKELSSALQIDGQPECLPNKRTWFIGEIASSASRRHPVYLEFSAVSSTITSDIKDLLLFEIEKPSLILTTGKYAPNAALTRLLKSRHCILACADDFADIRDDCSFTPKQDVKILFKDFVEEAKSDEKKSAGFDFPKGKTWENLRIHFLDGHTLTFDVNGSISTHTREEMDLGNAQWQMQKAFAKSYGAMPNGEIRASDKDKKRLQRLNNSLAAFCHTPELGIRLTADGLTYQCRFKITPETHCTEHHPTKNIKHF